MNFIVSRILKTFGSVPICGVEELNTNEHPMPIHLLQIMLGHMNVKNTAHYLLISDDFLAA
jgi:hypothetical protein